MLRSFFLNKKWTLWAWGGFAFIIGSLMSSIMSGAKSYNDYDDSYFDSAFKL